MKTMSTAECEKCKFCTIVEENKGRVFIQCEARNRRYFYGQRIMCEDKEDKK